MEQVLYTSRATGRLLADDVFRIIETSSRNNPQRDVTGFLVFAGDRFLQVVEGPREGLDELIGVLARDPRHADMQILSREPIAGRSFPNWRMQRFDAANGDVAALCDTLRQRGACRRVVALVEGFLERREPAA